MANISPQAKIAQGAQLAPDVVVGSFSYIGSNVVLSEGCIIENNVSITGRTVLGPRNHVFPLAVVGAAEDGGDDNVQCVIGEDNFIREHVAIYGGRDKPTRMGSDNLVMIDSHVGGGATVGDHCIFANCTHILQGAAVEDYVRTSGFITVEPSVRVGAYSFIAGFAVIDSDAPPFAMLLGFPYRVRGVNTQNLKRCGFSDDDIHALKDAFREIFNGQAERINKQVIARMVGEKDKLNPHIRRLIDAIEAGEGKL